MTDDVKALIAEAKKRGDGLVASGWFDNANFYHAVAAALEATTVAPAVDREALAMAMYTAYTAHEWNRADEHERADWLRVAHDVIASGLLRDVRDVRKEGYDEGWEDAILEFAPEHGQAIRETRNA